MASFTPKDSEFKLALERKDIENAKQVFYIGLYWEKGFFLGSYNKRAIAKMLKNQEIFVK